MPSQKSRSKDDTWTTDELNRALNKTSERRHHRDRDEDRKRERINGEEKHRRHRDEDSDRRHHRDDDDRRKRERRSKHDDEDAAPEIRLTEEERERLRRERRSKREGKDGKENKEKGEIKFRGKGDNRYLDVEDANEEKEDDRRHRRGDRERRHKDDDRERRHKEERRRKYEEEDEEDERERRRRERRKEKEEEEKRRKEKDKRKEDDRDRRRDREERSERHRDREERSERHRDREERSDRHRDREERSERHRDQDERSERHREKSDRHRDREERHRDRRERENEEDKEARREREREERRREREERHKSKDDKKHRSSRHEEEEEKPVKKEEEDDDYGNYEDDFEDYEEDFEEDDDDEDDNDGRTENNRLRVNNDELGDVLRALDEENERLLSASSRSPVGSRGYGRDNDDRQGRSYRDDSDDENEQTFQPRMDRPRTAINFVSAKQRAMSRKTASKTMQRGHDLLKMIELDYASFDLLDLPPVSEYDLYIRAFGSSDTRQAYVQTNDDNIDRDIQTEEVDVRQKWTQHPSEDSNGCGRGDGERDLADEEEEESHYIKQHNQETGHLNAFIQRAAQVIAILLEESKEEEGGQDNRSRSHINISDGFTQISPLPILQGRHVIYSHFSPTQPNLLMTVYSPAPEVTEDNPVSKRGVICVWNTSEPSYPVKILVSSSQPQCCCFSPMKPALGFAGMVDGSIAMWDLREAATLHQPTVINGEEYSLRYPTYDTAGVLNEENHHSPVSSIVPIYSYIHSSQSDSKSSQAADDTSSLSFQLVSTEESAVLHFWVVAELASSDLAGSQTDLGLAPGAGVKILKSSSMTMEDPVRDTMMKTTLRALDMKLMPSDPNNFYIATDAGKIIHGVRFGKRVFPRAHLPVIETIVDVVSMDFSPFDQPCFLVGCSDGSFSIYHTKKENPLVTWASVTKGAAVQCVRWSRSRPCVFYILDDRSTLYIFDLLEGDNVPKQVENISKERVTSLALTNDYRTDGLGIPGKDAQILFSLANGSMEIHTISKDLRDPQDLEVDFLASYLSRF